MTPQDARRAVIDALTEVAPEADPAALPDDAALRTELELDSLDFLTFVELLSGSARIRIDETDYPRLATLASSVELVVERTT